MCLLFTNSLNTRATIIDNLAYSKHSVVFNMYRSTLKCQQTQIVKSTTNTLFCLLVPLDEFEGIFTKPHILCGTLTCHMETFRPLAKGVLVTREATWGWGTERRRGASTEYVQ